MEPEHIIDETVIIQVADIEKVYDNCVSWLKNLGAKISNENINNSIISTHEVLIGRRKGPNYFKYKKKILIELTDGKEYTKVRIIMDRDRDPYYETEEHRELFKEHWIDLVVDMWKFIGVTPKESLLRRFYPRDRLERRADHELSIFKVSVIPYIALLVLTVPTMGGIGFFLSFIALIVLTILQICTNRRWRQIFRLKQNPWRLMLALYANHYSNDGKTKFLAWITS